MQHSTKKIYIFDLDGTICTSEDGNYHKAMPFEDRIEKVNKLYDEGHIIHIDSARGSETGIDWQLITERQLKQWGVKYHKCRTGKKMYGDFYVDDKALKDSYFFA